LQSFDNETDKTDHYQSSYERSPLGADQGAVSDLAPGFPGATTHNKYHVRHDGLSEDTGDRGIDYNAREVGNKNTRDFDSDRNARH
jgi:hypothetical protein